MLLPPVAIFRVPLEALNAARANYAKQSREFN